MQPMPDHFASVSERLRARTVSGDLQCDPIQSGIALELDRIIGDLKANRAAAKASALGWFFAKRRHRTEPTRGLYIHGSVGRGKTMLMDMFFDLAPFSRKRRAHFHEFMADVHDRIHTHRQKLKNGETKQTDPVPPVADAIVAEAELLCFDEFTVTDIADAMILSRLFSALFARGCVLVATSNVAPDDLYREGLNRDLFLPFIQVLKDHVNVVTLDGPTDYRMEKLDSLPVYHTPLNAEADRAMDLAWSTAVSGQREKPSKIPIKGRLLAIPRAARGAARFTFSELCEQPLGASDYLAIAETFHTVFVDHVPLLDPGKRNAVKRLIILVDTFYDHGIRLVMSAAALPEALLIERKGVEGFEFARTASRLFEMRSRDYLDRHRQKYAA